MRLIVLPLGQGPLTMCRVLFLVEEFIENFHGLLIRDDALTIKLVFPVTESNHIICSCQSVLVADYRLVIAAH
jgi:hypothetical protein